MIGVSVPSLVVHDVGQVKSYGVAAHRRRAWLGGGSLSPRNRPRAVFLSVGSFEPGYYFLPPPTYAVSRGVGVAAHPRRSRLNERFPGIEDPTPGTVYQERMTTTRKRQRPFGQGF
jgi:hypothetical protein